jgi:F420-dependent methylenetetrahydromethanopterin dehydrogenase
MSACSNNLIEKYAEMVEKSDHLDPNEMAERTMDIILMLSNEPALSNTMNQINAKLRSIIANAKEIKLDSVLSATDSKAVAAAKIRELKNTRQMMH